MIAGELPDPGTGSAIVRKLRENFQIKTLQPLEMLDKGEICKGAIFLNALINLAPVQSWRFLV